jgi:hypothetical protein
MQNSQGWTRVVGALVVCGLAAGPAAADDRAAALAVVERAVKAHGGAEVLGRAAAAVRTGKGVLLVGGSEVPFTTDEALNLPNSLRVRVEVGRTEMVRVLNGNRGWQRSGGETAEIGRDRLGEIQEEAYVWWLVTLAPLLKAGFDLTPLPDVKVNDRPAAGVKVAARNRPAVALYFDKETGLLVKIARRAREAGLPVEKEYFYSAYKEIAGVKLPTRETVTLNGRKFSDTTYGDYQLRQPDEGAFARP